ncbi:snRNA-activating protein complex subunit 4 isoform X1 [Sapajus apella]|uniref:snRNA-activating protein complex subunit 4 n=2 Tax=Sapajus apella TaxID=9515 RepID=A0A6J3GI78_SAPAP|nr:snRNA-activating protein complex subunit 4 isoform X1 [Sapajus apella]XP_032117643.1 snRNA-activating protein complex subunit 4 isoform X1 [Sapajus apella]XP_032117644.1 snRNA-activating protein complex subunit 4 isoform X1 [Sapajus apella]XP_032117645.1 snRNA-activating protein complex subunit 4 isoform X1 [Sapajus apella]XP_032117646.1 snRNA-activating protein complex subunit 4 isoform X1 [Sapajus apella]XP_032117647.1 snRNA-activating protein complex subunit 4 isoform X1 [Sapajus apella]
MRAGVFEGEWDPDMVLVSNILGCVLEVGEVMDIDAEREKITQEIKELERILDPSSSSTHMEISESSFESDSEADSPPSEDPDAADALISDEERWGEASNDEDDPKDKTLPEDPETCLQLNMVYQEVIQEKLADANLLLAQNREQQEELMRDLAGSKGTKVKDGKSLPPSTYMGHFMKPYFKDKVTGVGPPANEDTREKAAQGIKAFEELLVTKWKNWEKALLRKSVVSDRLQRLLQPKLLKLEYLQQKQSRVSSEPERQVLEKQAREAEKEIQDINQLPEEALLGNRLDSHDWEKISNMNFEGSRSAEEIQKFWQNSEHPSINKQEWSREELERLQVIAAAHGHLEWQRIAEELGTNRSAFQCLQKFQQHNKTLKRKEWTEEEDRMLTQLVQEMRVGSHIPYRRIVYYMEGRDSMQLIYRWTKSLDPALKKGCWAPEEDAKLLQAVAKYGEQDWFKIREEVPGRSDAQCRDRYLRRLHFSLKKGRWNLKEEEQLIELIEKYGVGHWAKIASELPHRSGSQCLSKWKIMMGKKQGLRRRRRRARHRVRWSSSSSSSSSSGDSSRVGGSSSSSSSDEEEPEQAQAREGGRALLSPQYVVPDMDLWVPVRQSTRGAGGWLGCPAASPSPLKGSTASQGDSKEASATPTAPGEERSPAQAPSRAHSPVPRAAQASHLADTQPAGVEKQAPECGRRLLTVPVETVLRVLRANTAARSCTQKEQLRQPPLPSSPPGVSPGDSMARSHVRWLRHRAAQSGQRRWRQALHRRLLDRRLLLAVTPWVGDVVLPCTEAPQRPATVQTRADGVREQLQQAHLTSTPVFTLFTQLFQIDTAGCLEVVRERKALPPRLPRVGARHPSLHLPQASSSAQSTPGRPFPNVPAQEASKSASHKGSQRRASSRAECTLPQASTLAPTGPRPKRKTVSELLQEKRLQEARAREAARGPVVLPSQLLVSSPVVLQPPLPHAPHCRPAPGPVVSNAPLSGPGTPAAARPGTSGFQQEVGTSATDKRLSTLQALPLAPAFTGAEGTAPSLSPDQISVSCPGSGLGQSQAPAASRKQGLPEAPPFLPAAPSPAPPPVQPLSLTHVGGPGVVASVPLPVTWVLTAQGLLPVPVPAVVGLPRPVGTPGPTGLLATLLPPLTETQAAQDPRAVASMNVEPEPSCRTDPPAPPTQAPSQSPAEVDGSVALVPGEAQVAREIPAPMTSTQTDPPEAEPLWPRRLPDLGGAIPASEPAGTPGSPSGTQEPRGPLGLERPPLPQPGPEKGALDLGLLSQEGETATQEWLGGRRGVHVPPLVSRLPYQPPALCSLRALAGLLLHKKALEHKAASLVRLPAGVQTQQPTGVLQASRGLVQGQLQDNPAYLLLRARFLAAFTLPALLATLAPHGIHTTLSAASMAGSESEEEDLSELELADGARQLGHRVATQLVQGAPDSGECSASPCQGASDDLDVDDLDVLRTRHARHTRKRNWLV